MPIYMFPLCCSLLGLPVSNQDEKFKSLKSKENIHKNEDGPDCTVPNDKFSSVTLYKWL